MSLLLCQTERWDFWKRQRWCSLWNTVLESEKKQIPLFFFLIIPAIRQASITPPVQGCELRVEIQSCAIYEAEGIKRDPFGRIWKILKAMIFFQLGWSGSISCMIYIRQKEKTPPPLLSMVRPLDPTVWSSLSGHILPPCFFLSHWELSQWLGVKEIRTDQLYSSSVWKTHSTLPHSQMSSHSLNSLFSRYTVKWPLNRSSSKSTLYTCTLPYRGL